MPTNKKNPESERGESERREEQVPEEAQTQTEPRWAAQWTGRLSSSREKES